MSCHPDDLDSDVGSDLLGYYMAFHTSQRILPIGLWTGARTSNLRQEYKARLGESFPALLLSHLSRQVVYRQYPFGRLSLPVSVLVSTATCFLSHFSALSRQLMTIVRSSLPEWHQVGGGIRS